MNDPDPEREILRFYNETAAFYDRVSSQVPALKWGWKILYGPPFRKPPILFIGHQPGWSKTTNRETAIFEQTRWQSRFEYADPPVQYRLALEAQKLLSREKLARCVGLNSIFIRCPRISEYDRLLRDQQGLKDEIQRFCFERVQRIISLLEPESLMLIGFANTSLWNPEMVEEYYGRRGNPILRKVKINGLSAWSSLHLSGCRIANADIGTIGELIGLQS